MDGFDPDVDLMLKVRNGDTEAFNAILSKYQRPIINYLYRCLNRRDEAEELAQEVFLRVYTARHRYEPTAKFSSWIYKIATNLFLKELGRRHRMPAKDLGSQAEDTMDSSVDRLADSRPTVLQDMETSERERLISESIQGLPSNEKTALLLRKYHELAYKEIAEAMGCTEGAIKTYIHRGKLRLRERLISYLKEGAS
jgi:RNA polymerase sigma-70 factor, ECF subfamily